MAKRKEDKVIHYMENLKKGKGSGAALNADMSALAGKIDLKPFKPKPAKKEQRRASGQLQQKQSQAGLKGPARARAKKKGPSGPSQGEAMAAMAKRMGISLTAEQKKLIKEGKSFSHRKKKE